MDRRLRLQFASILLLLLLHHGVSLALLNDKIHRGEHKQWAGRCGQRPVGSLANPPGKLRLFSPLRRQRYSTYLPAVSSDGTARDNHDGSPNGTRSGIRQLFRTTLSLGLIGVSYGLHLGILSQNLCIIAQRWAVGYDTLVGMAVVVGRAAVLGVRRSRGSPSSSHASTCWNFSSRSTVTQRTSLLAILLLMLGYLSTGTLALRWDDWVYQWSLQGWPWMTLGVARALPVLLGHMTWTLLALWTLSLVVRPYFWNRPSCLVPPPTSRDSANTNPTTDAAGVEVTTANATSSISQGKFHWIVWCREGWIRWTIGGYAVTATVFHLVDRLNQTWWLASSASTNIWNAAPPSLVAELVAPEGRDTLAFVLGSIAPCLTAPFLEEILYRGFGLAALSHLLAGKVRVANVIQSLLFALHHRSAVGLFPLWALGLLWGHIYQRSHSLLSVVTIHALWNARVFLGSWWGLCVV